MPRRAAGPRTPDAIKPEIGEAAPRTGKRWRRRQNPAKITVDEPLMLMLDEVMRYHGVSSVRLETFLGLGVDRLKYMRRHNAAWGVITTVRRCLWAMGFDIEMRLVRVAKPDDELVLSLAERQRKEMRKLHREREPWDMTRIWQTLGLEKLPVSDELEKTD